MVRIIRPIRRVHSIPTVRWIRDKEADGVTQSDGERSADVGRCLVEEGSQLGVVGAVDEEEAEAGVGVHYADEGLVVVAV